MIRLALCAARMPQLLAAVLLLAASLWLPGAHAEVRAWLDRSAIGMGETVTLNIESNDRQEPDFSVLEPDFRIASRSTNTQVQIVNGAMARTNLWAVALEPLREGVIELPPIPVGGDRTAPLQLTVRPMARGSAANGDEVFMEVEVDSPAPYVQQQVGLTLRLFYAVALLDGNLDEPAGEGLQVRRVGQDAQYSRRVGGRAYNVVERHYVLTPERSGPLTVGSVTFRGRLASGASPGSFFSQGTPVVTGSDPVAMDVRPAPADASSPWLPARALRFTDTSSSLPAQARVGDALELSLRVEAEGLSAEQLPELALPPIEGAEIYPDQETRETRESGTGLVGVRSRKFAIVPLREGRLELPERSLTWWNTGADQRQRSALPALSIEVLPAPASSAAARPAPATAVPEAAAGDAFSAPWAAQARLWQLTTLIFATAWIGTVLLWLLNARRRARAAGPGAPVTPAASSWRPELAHALARADLAAARRALLRIAPGTRDLESLAHALAAASQREAVRALDRALYRGDAVDGLVEQLRAAFARKPVLASEAAPAAPDEQALPPLYPPR